jgi:predicted SAM-dependent methyltransferase
MADALVKLNLGCGTDYKTGWTNIDNNSDNNITKLDLSWDLREPLPFEENFVDFIYNEHFIEHLSVEEGQRFLGDCLRVLKPGGVIRIATPDLAHIVDRYLNVPLESDPVIKRFHMEFIKTRGERINIEFRDWGHKWLYDWDELERRLRQAGFHHIVRVKIQQSEHPELRNLETREESILIAEVTK